MMKYKRLIIEPEKALNSILTILVIAYFLLYIADSYIIVDATLTTYSAFFVSVLAFLIILISPRKQGLLQEEILFYSLILIMHAVSIIHNQNISYGSLILVMKHFFIAMVLARVKLDKAITKITYYALSVYFLYLMITGFDVTLFSLSVSQNAISLHLALFLSLFILSSSDDDFLNRWITAGIALIVSIWTGCRGGIIACGTILIGVYYCALKKTDYKHVTLKNLLVFAGAILITAAGLVYISNKIGFEKYLFMLTRDRASMRGNIRFTMIEEYIQAATRSITNFLFGAPLSDSAWISHYGNNPHNSYIYAHAHFGLLFLIIIIFLIIKNGYKYIKNKDLLGFVLAGLLLRAFSDSPAFPGIYDAIIYLLIFEMPLFARKNLITNPYYAQINQISGAGIERR